MFQGENLIMGVLADSVSQVVELSADEIEAHPAFRHSSQNRIPARHGSLGKKFCLILDIDKVLSADEVLAVY